MVDKERWAEIDRIFQQVMDLPADERLDFVDRECTATGSPQGIREEILELLEAASLDLIAPAVDAAAVSFSADSRPDDGTRIGSYRLLESLGKGGMGQVFRAIRDDDEYRHEVALKMLRPGVAHGDEVTRRFLAERQILASLEHAFIARLIDGGTHQGRPYLVMEYAREGQPIDQYVKDHKLATRDKLQLFLKVCAAVQHAHQRLIVHRDLKPSNILVLPDGSPKLLDFGIAKLLDDAGGEKLLTATGWLMMTPDYASPEQVKGEAITVASDVYSLGVVLYELLTGERPYRIKSYTPSEIQQAVCTGAVAAPSSVVTRASRLKRQLEGDIDTIVLMALRKEPQRRYATVEQLAADLSRHLEGLPVQARRDTFGYRASKFLRRNRAVVVLSGLLSVAILTGGVISVREGRRSQKRFNEVRSLANSILTEVDLEARSLPGSTKLRNLLAQKSLRYLDSLAAETGNDAGLALELASAYHRVADILGHPHSPNLGDKEGAMLSHLRALQIEEYWWNHGHQTTHVRQALALGYSRLADLYTATGDDAKAVVYLDRAEPLIRPEEPEAYLPVRLAMSRRAYQQGELRKSAQLDEQAYLIAEKLDDPAHAMVIADNVAVTYCLLGRSKSMLHILRKALDLAEKKKARWAGDSGYESRMAKLLGDYGSGLGSILYPSEGRYCEAIPYYKRSLEITEEQLKPEPEKVKSRTMRQVQMVGSYMDLASTTASCGREDGEPFARKAISLNPGTPMTSLTSILAFTQWKAGRFKEAMNTLRPALTPGQESITAVEFASRVTCSMGDKPGAWRYAALARKLRSKLLDRLDNELERTRFLQAENLHFAITTGDPTPGLREELKRLVALFPVEADAATLDPIRKLAVEK